MNTELIMKVYVNIAKPLVVGDVPNGFRRIIPITGGYFEGPQLNGKVLEGGADWNLLREDGAKEYWARYTLQTDDGVLISILNEGLNHGTVEENNRYSRSIPKFEVENGKYDWLNNYIFIGTHESDPENQRVILEFYKVL